MSARHAAALPACEGQRYTVEPNGVHGWYVADNESRTMSSGPYQTRGQAAYECDHMRRPSYPSGTARPHWESLPDHIRDNWERHPTPRDWK